MATMTKEEIQAWAADKKRKKGDKLVVTDESVSTASIPHVTKEFEKL